MKYKKEFLFFGISRKINKLQWQIGNSGIDSLEQQKWQPLQKVKNELVSGKANPPFLKLTGITQQKRKKKY